MLSLLDAVFGPHHPAPSRNSIFHRVNAVMALRRSRARLAELDPHLLADIGLDTDAALTEARRPVWDAPDAWRS